MIQRKGVILNSQWGILTVARKNLFQKLNPRRPKEFWRAMKYLNKCQSNIPTLIDEDGIQANSGSQKVDLLNSKCFNRRSSEVQSIAAVFEISINLSVCA